MSSSPSSAGTKRACDACHRRKVKCTGDPSKPCKNCAASGLACTYNAVPQKKGPKGGRAKIISELRETQRLSTPQRAKLDDGADTTTFSRSNPALPGKLIDACLAFFFDNLYPTQPILELNAVNHAIDRMDDDIEAYVFVISFCAYMCIQPRLDVPDATLALPELRGRSPVAIGQQLLKEATRARKALDWIDSPTVWSVVTSFFLFGSYFCLDKHNLAWFHLREATTIAQLVGMHEEQYYDKLSRVEMLRVRRLYWLLFVTERAYALQQHRPLTLHATIKLPAVDEDPAKSVELSGFIRLVALFRPFDDTFVGLWNKAKTGAPPTTWLANLQQELSDALPVYLECTEAQAVDLRLSQSWLKTMVWQLSISHGALSSLATDNAMSLRYPIAISHELLAASSHFSQRSMEVHGIGLVEKLFDIACTLTDVISCVPYEQHTFEFGPRDYLSQIVQLISKLRGGQQRYMPLLSSKISETLPHAPFSLSLIPEGQGSGASESLTSDTASMRSTPFGSPPLSASSAREASYGSFPSVGMGVSPTMSNPSDIIATCAEEAGGLVFSPAMQAFHNPMAFHGYSNAGLNG